MDELKPCPFCGGKVSNEPLTLEELRDMIGCWVWVVVHYEHCECVGWALVGPCYLAYLEQTIPFDFYGKKAIAYRKPPEGESYVNV